MTTGTVKWFNTRKGYGFITPDEGQADVFVHVTEVKSAGLPALAEGQRLSFDVIEEAKGLKATKLEAVDE